MEHWVQDSRPCTKWSHCWEFAFSISKIWVQRNKPLFRDENEVALHEYKDPWSLPHRIFLGRKIDLQVNGIWNRTALSLNYPEVFLGKWHWSKIFWSKNCLSKGLNNLGQIRTTLLSNCIEFKLPIENGACQKITG